MISLFQVSGISVCPIYLNTPHLYVKSTPDLIQIFVSAAVHFSQWWSSSVCCWLAFEKSCGWLEHLSQFKDSLAKPPLEFCPGLIITSPLLYLCIDVITYPCHEPNAGLACLLVKGPLTATIPHMKLNLLMLLSQNQCWNRYGFGGIIMLINF